MSVDGDDHAHGSNHQYPGEQELASDIGTKARDQHARDNRERSDHSVDRKPAHAQEEGEHRTRVGATVAEDAPSKDDLGQAALRSGVAEQAQNNGAGHRTDKDRKQAVPHPQPVVGRQQAGGQQTGVVDEGAGPEKAQFSRTAVPLGSRNGVDAVRLDLEKGVRRDLIEVGLCGHVYPSAGITQIRFEGLAERSTSQRSKRTPLSEYNYQTRSSFHGSAPLFKLFRSHKPSRPCSAHSTPSDNLTSCP